jgi:hypothetical protein
VERQSDKSSRIAAPWRSVADRLSGLAAPHRPLGLLDRVLLLAWGAYSRT